MFQRPASSGDSTRCVCVCLYAVLFILYRRFCVNGHLVCVFHRVFMLRARVATHKPPVARSPLNHHNISPCTMYIYVLHSDRRPFGIILHTHHIHISLLPIRALPHSPLTSNVNRPSRTKSHTQSCSITLSSDRHPSQRHPTACGLMDSRSMKLHILNVLFDNVSCDGVGGEFKCEIYLHKNL